jgi:hypothetical protein
MAISNNVIDWDADESTPSNSASITQSSNINWDAEPENTPKQESHFIDRLLTETLKLGKNTVVGMYELGADTYKLIKNERERNKNLGVLEQAQDVYKTGKSLGKGALSSSTFGYYEGGEPQDERDRILREWGQLAGFGKIIGSTSQFIKNGLKGFVPQGLATLFGFGGSMAGYNATQQMQELATGKRENLDAAEMASHFIVGGSIPAAIEATPAGARFLDELKPSQKLKTLKGQIPPDLPPSSYRMLVDEVVPEMKQIFMDEFRAESETARKNLQISYEEKLAQAESEYSKYIDDLMKENKLTEESYNAAEAEIMEKNRLATEEYQAEVQRIEAENAQSMQEFEQASQAWDEYVTRNRQIEEAIEMRARHDNTNDIGFRESAPTETIPTTRNTIGNIISQNEITNPTSAGRTLQQVIRQTAEMERRPVNRLYEQSDNLNSSITHEAPDLVNWLEREIAELETIPSLSGPSKSLLNSYQSMLSNLVEIDAEGNISNYRPVANRVLLEQAKELRNKVDYDFDSGNPTRVFQRYIDELQNQAERAALETGNDAAYQANIEARTAHRAWKNRYDQDFIRDLRDVSDVNYQQALDKSLSVDNYSKIEPILNQSNPGGNLASAIKRELVQDHLKSATDNPSRFDAESRQLLLRDLEPITSLEQRTALNDALKIAQREAPSEPKAPKLKEPPKPPKLTESRLTKQIKEPETIKLPEKPKLKSTPQMKYLERKMSLTPEQLYKEMNTPTGIHQIKETLSKTDKGKSVLKKIQANEVKDIIYGEKIAEPKTGREIYERVNQKANYDKLVEWIGQEETDMFLKKAKEIGDKPAPKTEFEKMYSRDRALRLLSWSAGILF